MFASWHHRETVTNWAPRVAFDLAPTITCWRKTRIGEVRRSRRR